MNIAFYLRLSLSDGDLGKNNKDESNSIENQRLLLQSFVESMDELDGEVREYIDDGYSGTNFNRPAFQDMIEDAKKGKVDVLLVKDLSRLGRDYIGVGDYLEQIFPIMGVRVIAINSQYDSNNYVGKTMGLEMSISNLVNTLYSRDLSKKKVKAEPAEKNEAVAAPTNQTPEQKAEEVTAKVARKLNRIPFYPKDWQNSFGLPVAEHKKALKTNLADGYIEFSSTR